MYAFKSLVGFCLKLLYTFQRHLGWSLQFKMAAQDKIEVPNCLYVCAFYSPFQAF